MKWGSFLGAFGDSFDKSFSGVPATYNDYLAINTGKAARAAAEEQRAREKASNAAKVPTAPTPTTPTDATQTPTVAAGGGGGDEPASSGGSYDPKAPLKGTAAGASAGGPGGAPGGPAAPEGYGTGLRSGGTDPLSGRYLPDSRNKTVDFSDARRNLQFPTEATPDPVAYGSGSALATGGAPTATAAGAPVVGAPVVGEGASATAALPPPGRSAADMPGAHVTVGPDPETGMMQPRKVENFGPAVRDAYNWATRGSPKSPLAPPPGGAPRSYYSNKDINRDPKTPAGNPATGIPRGGLTPERPAPARMPDGSASGLVPDSSVYPSDTQVAPSGGNAPTRSDGVVVRPRSQGRQSSNLRRTIDPRYPNREVPMQVSNYLPGAPSLANTAVRPLDMLQALKTTGYG